MFPAEIISYIHPIPPMTPGRSRRCSSVGAPAVRDRLTLFRGLPDLLVRWVREDRSDLADLRDRSGRRVLRASRVQKVRRGLRANRVPKVRRDLRANPVEYSALPISLR